MENILNKLRGKKESTDTGVEKQKGSCDSYLSAQVNKELKASLFYQMCQNYCDKNGYPTASEFYKNQSVEERTHSTKVLEFMQGRDMDFSGYKIDFDNPTFTSLVDVIEQSYELEKGNTESLAKLYVHSQEDKDFLVQAFSLMMLEEQIEEEKTFKDLLAVAKGLKVDDKLDMLHLDEYFEG